ncbi:hypothetical protein BFp0038 (plasmid) [Bacteroides fragilis YCH46]|uniref:Uncharacterized protein n=1 Tax=Bacteroides fragilis (strain YCH46) TaxID=295405 RepID=Q64MC2_BACFR|nr:hypothetical protein BFp0038 [Bacteroides fragilis YCH46]
MGGVLGIIFISSRSSGSEKTVSHFDSWASCSFAKWYQNELCLVSMAGGSGRTQVSGRHKRKGCNDATLSLFK